MKFSIFLSIKNKLCVWFTIDLKFIVPYADIIRWFILRVPRRDTWIEFALNIFDKWLVIGSKPARWVVT